MEELNKKDPKSTFVFDKTNYTLLLVAIAILVTGFLLMVGGESIDPDGFNPEIFSHRRITLAPIVVIAGFIFAVFAIMKKPKSE